MQYPNGVLSFDKGYCMRSSEWSSNECLEDTNTVTRICCIWCWYEAILSDTPPPPFFPPRYIVISKSKRPYSFNFEEEIRSVNSHWFFLFIFLFIIVVCVMSINFISLHNFFIMSVCCELKVITRKKVVKVLCCVIYLLVFIYT